MFESDRLLHIRIWLLLKWQLDITANRIATVLKSPAISRFHNTRPASGHSSKPDCGNAFSKFPGCYIIFMVFVKTCGTKYGYAWSNKMKCPEILL